MWFHEAVYSNSVNMKSNCCHRSRFPIFSWRVVLNFQAESLREYQREHHVNSRQPLLHLLPQGGDISDELVQVLCTEPSLKLNDLRVHFSQLLLRLERELLGRLEVLPPS